MGDGLLGGGHHRVVGSDDDDGDIGNLGTTGTHGGKRLVARGIEEGHLAAVLHRHAIGADVLGDTSGLAGYHVGVADMVEQRGLTVVYVAHHGNDWRTRHEVGFVVFLYAHGFLNLSTHILGLEAELFGHQVDGLGVEALVDRHHDAYAHEGRDDLGDAHVHHRGELAHGNKLGELERLALLALGLCLLGELLLDGLSLLLAVLGALLVLVLVGKAGKRLFHLACYSFVVYLERLLVALAVLAILAVATVVGIIGVVGIGVIVVAVTVLLLVAAVVALSLGVDVHALLSYALALLLLAVLGLCLFLTLLSLFLLGLLLGSGALVDGVKVYLAQHIDLGGIGVLGFGGELEDSGCSRSLLGGSLLLGRGLGSLLGHGGCGGLLFLLLCHGCSLRLLGLGGLLGYGLFLLGCFHLGFGFLLFRFLTYGSGLTLGIVGGRSSSWRG